MNHTVSNSCDHHQVNLAWFSALGGKSGRFTELLSPFFPHARIFSDCSSKAAHYLQAFSAYRERPFSQSFFCLEDDASSAFVQTALRSFPGLTLFLDSNFNRLEFSKLAFSSNGILLDEKMVEDFGSDYVKLGDFQARGWSIEVFDHFFPQGQDQMQDCALAVFSSESGADNFNKRRSSKKNAEKIYFPLEQLSDDRVRETKKELSNHLSNESLPIIAYAGEFVLEDRLETVLQLKEALNDRAQFVYISRANVALELKKSISEEGLRVIEAKDEKDFAKIIHGADIFLAPRLDKLRGQSLGFYHALEAGLSVVSLDCGEASDYPDDVVLKVKPGKHESLEMERILVKLLENTDLRISLNQNIKNFISNCASSEIVSAELRFLLSQNADYLDSVLATEVRQTQSEVRKLVESLKLLEDDQVFRALASGSAVSFEAELNGLVRK